MNENSFIIIKIAKSMDPTYIVNFENGRGLKLVAISTDNSIAKGHIAHYANSIHPAHKFPMKNAKLSLRDKVATDNNGIKKKVYSAGDIGFFRLKALNEIRQGEEVITDYGDGYWKTMSEWQLSTQKNLLAVPKHTDREQRMKKRRIDI